MLQTVEQQQQRQLRPRQKGRSGHRKSPGSMLLLRPTRWPPQRQTRRRRRRRRKKGAANIQDATASADKKEEEEEEEEPTDSATASAEKVEANDTEVKEADEKEKATNNEEARNKALGSVCEDGGGRSISQDRKGWYMLKGVDVQEALNEVA